MAEAAPLQRSQADSDAIARLEAEVKRLAEQDKKRQAELDDLAKARAAADKEHADQLGVVQKEVDQLKGEVTRLQGVEAEQH